jgi:hypothetical protein
MNCHLINFHLMSCHLLNCLSMNCHSMNCHSMNCHSMNCHSMNCHSMNCHSMNCHSINCHSMNCHSMNCHSMNCHSMNCHSMNCHSMNCHSMNCHLMNCHSMNCHSMNCHLWAAVWWTVIWWCPWTKSPWTKCPWTKCPWTKCPWTKCPWTKCRLIRAANPAEKSIFSRAHPFKSELQPKVNTKSIESHFFCIFHLPICQAPFRTPSQGCQMVYFHTKNPNLGIFCRASEWKLYVYFMTIWSIFAAILYILWPLALYFSVVVCCTIKNLATLLLLAEMEVSYHHQHSVPDALYDQMSSCKYRPKCSPAYFCHN